MEIFLPLVTAQMVGWVCTVIAHPGIDTLHLDFKKLHGER